MREMVGMPDVPGGNVQFSFSLQKKNDTEKEVTLPLDWN